MICPVCGDIAIPQGGCYTCMSCGWSACDNRTINHAKYQMIVEEEPELIRVVPISKKRRKYVKLEGLTVLGIFFNHLN
jgi:hypothetical protein